MENNLENLTIGASGKAAGVNVKTIRYYQRKDVREKLAHLKRLESALVEHVRACHTRRGNVSCPLIGSLQAGKRLRDARDGRHKIRPA